MGSIERGETNPTLTSLAIMTKALKITLANLLDGID